MEEDCDEYFRENHVAPMSDVDVAAVLTALAEVNAEACGQRRQSAGRASLISHLEQNGAVMARRF